MKECIECHKLIDERDFREEWADKLANAIAEYFNKDIGEHSNCNLPWENAYEMIPNKPKGDNATVGELKERLKNLDDKKQLVIMTKGIVGVFDIIDCVNDSVVLIQNKKEGV